MEPELRNVIDRLAIMELTAKYNQAYFEEDYEAFVATFTPDGIYHSTNAEVEFVGHDAIEEMVRFGTARSVGGTQHMTDGLPSSRSMETALHNVQPCFYIGAKAMTSQNEIVGTGHYRDDLGPPELLRGGASPGGSSTIGATIDLSSLPTSAVPSQGV